MAKRPYSPPSMTPSNKYKMMVIHNKHVVIDVSKAIDALGAFTVGAIKKRTNLGIDVSGKPFEQYSRRYQAALRSGGEQTKPDLRVTGSMLSSLKVIGRGNRLGVQYVRIGFDATYGPAYKLKDNKIIRTGMRKITNGALARVHHYGIGRVKRRRFFGLSRQEKKEASQHALKYSIVQEVRGQPRRLT